MECISPILSNTEKHGRIFLPCGKCIPCIQRKGRDWFVRLSLEWKYFKGSAYFVTLTYNDESVPITIDDEKGIAYYDFDKNYIQKFIKRLRHDIDGKFKYFLIGEKGGLHGRPHYHAVFLVDLNQLKFDQLLNKYWTVKKKPLGFITIEQLNDNRICYITDYMLAKEDQTNFRLMSKGLGKDYTDRQVMRKYHHKTLDGLVRVNTQEYPMPRYLREKIHSQLERQIIGKEMQKKSIEGIESRHVRYNDMLNRVRIKKEKRQRNSNKKYYLMKMKNEKYNL